MRLKDGELKINLSGANCMNTLLSIMITEHFLPVVKQLRSQKEEWFSHGPICPKWPMHAIRMKSFFSSEIWSEISSMNSHLDLHESGMSGEHSLWLMLVRIIKLFICCHCHWGSLPTYTYIQHCFRVIDHGSNKWSETVSEPAEWV